MTSPGLSVVLPTFNEAENLKILIPELLVMANLLKLTNFQVLVADDNSSDGTQDLVDKISSKDSRVRLVKRSGRPSLPDSIWDGIEASQNEFVAWLDADGSMPISTLQLMWETAISQGSDVVIGSRFVSGDGFKGLNQVGKTTIREYIHNIRNSQDSFLAVVLSKLLNVFLRICLKCGVKDMTSGFVIAKRILISKDDISGNYGDYFPKFVYRVSRRTTQIIEVGYVCLPRKHGESKTAPFPTSFEFPVTGALFSLVILSTIVITTSTTVTP